MNATLVLAQDTRRTAAILVLSLVAVEWGGTFLLKVVRRGAPATALQESFYRAGHAHAGVLVILGLVVQVFVSATALDGWWRTVASTGVPLAAILMPAGFFLSVAGRDAERPSRLIALVWLGALSLALGLLALGTGLLRPA